MKAKDLIDNSKHVWDESKIRHTFDEVTANQILGILLSRFSHADSLVWIREALGEFTVRSAYRLLLENATTKYGLQPNTIQTNFYKKLWSLMLSAKLKIAFWRFIRNFIPNFCNLHIKKISESNLCPRCSSKVETTTHALRDCPISYDIWKYMNHIWSVTDLQNSFLD